MNKLKTYLNLQQLPNILTIFRLSIAIPIIICFEIYKLSPIFYLLIVGILTDYFDGFFAKKLKAKSKFGAIIDPLADKVLTLIPLVWLSNNKVIPYWAISIIILRELIVSSFRTTQKDGLPATLQAKFKTVFIFGSLILFFFPYQNELVSNLGLVSFWIGFILTLSTSINYLSVK